MPTAAERFEAEARAQVIWGKSREETLEHLRSEGATLSEAETAYETVKNCRREFIQTAAKKKIFLGIGLICVPFVALAVFLAIHMIPLKLFGFTIVVGIIGAWKLIRGILGSVNPDSIHGDLSDEATE
jgi:hypothetical protein